MLIDVGLTTLVIALFAGILVVLSRSEPRAVRVWLGVALVEYLVCATIQYKYGADANGYRQAGLELAKLLDIQFAWASREVLALFLQQPSPFDRIVIGAGTNTGSMCAAAGGVLFLVRSSPYAAQALMAGLAMCGATAIYTALRDACPEVSPVRLFAGIVLFPSVAFWTSAIHKESFCLMGVGLLFSAWRAIGRRQFRAVPYACVGTVIILMIRAPALPPLILGLVAYFVMERVRKARGTEASVIGPVYLAMGLVALALGMILVTRVSPGLGLDRLGETVATQQQGWASVEGGSHFDTDAAITRSLGAQLASAPIALLNALFRPQLFDVTNPLVFASAVEMTAITLMVLLVLRRNGVVRLLLRIQRSPFLLMCTVITVVGFTFIGLTTRNFGSMARYRVPFLPFYGALLAVLTQRNEEAQQASSAPAPRARPDRRLSGLRSRPRTGRG